MTKHYLIFYTDRSTFVYANEVFGAEVICHDVNSEGNTCEDYSVRMW